MECVRQALHLADTQRRVYVVVQTHLQRGDFVWRSAKANVAAAPTWDRNQHVCEFKVEALEASGTLRYANQTISCDKIIFVGAVIEQHLYSTDTLLVCELLYMHVSSLHTVVLFWCVGLCCLYFFVSGCCGSFAARYDFNSTLSVEFNTVFCSYSRMFLL